MVFFLKMVKVSTFSCCNYYFCANTCSSFIQMVLVTRICLCTWIKEE